MELLFHILPALIETSIFIDFSVPPLSILPRQHDALTLHIMNIPVWFFTLKYTRLSMRFQHFALLIFSCMLYPLFFTGWEHQESPSGLAFKKGREESLYIF